MKKSLLSKSAVALAAGFLAAGAAQAIVVGPAGAPAVNTVASATVLAVNPAGLGHNLVVPYYTAQNGNDTYLSIVNTDMRNGKAVKVRFRGASNSDDVLDFTVLLSPGDVWAAAISKPAGQDLPKLTTSDKSCTLPAIPQNGVNFNPGRLHQKLSAAQQASETREGYVEIFNMADIPPVALPVAPAVALSLYRSIEHVNGVPRACADASVTALLDNNLVNTTTYLGAQAIGLEVPTSGLMANWNVVNVPSATSWSGAATAIEARTAAGVAGYGNVVLFPQIDSVTVPLATAQLFTSDALLRAGAATNVAAEVPGAVQPITALPVDFPDMSTPYLNADLAILAAGVATKSQTSRLMGSFATLSTANEFNTLAAVAGKNDWTFTMPTRRYNVVRQYDNAGANEGVGTTLYTNLTHDDAGVAIAPATSDYFVSGGQVVSNTAEGKRHQLCVTGITFSGGAKGGAEGGNRNSAVTADREEAFVAAGSNGAVFSPAVAGTPASFCGEASVLAFNAAGQSSALGAEVARREIGTPASEGWARFAHANGVLGLPVLGNSFVQFTNNAAATGVRGNYGLAWPHRTSIR